MANHSPRSDNYTGPLERIDATVALSREIIAGISGACI